MFYLIKIIGIISMLIDHIGVVFFPHVFLFRVIGRLSMPLFAWGIAYGYRKTKNFKIYAFRILLLAVVSQYPYYILFKNECLNICFTLVAGLFCIHIYELKKPLVLRILYIGTICFIVHIFDFEYGIYAVLLVLIYHIFYRKYYILFPLIVALTLWSIDLYNYNSIQIISVTSLGLIFLFEKSNFRINKIINYSFYPVHMLFLLIARMYIQ